MMIDSIIYIINSLYNIIVKNTIELFIMYLINSIGKQYYIIKVSIRISHNHLKL